MYETHKFMKLNNPQTTYFISQVGASAAAYGVSAVDVTIVANGLTGLFGRRCSAPAVLGPDPVAPQSICNVRGCPKASPASCAASIHFGSTDTEFAVLQYAAPPVFTETDIAVLQFALNLECLEAQFYSWAAHGKGLTRKQGGRGARAIGGKKALLSAKASLLAQDIAADEIAHVVLIRAALGVHAFSCPVVDIGPAFQAVVLGALNVTSLPVPFSPYEDDLLFYLGAFLFEDVGVTAYHYALGLVSKLVLPTASGIMATEAYHAGAIRTLLSLALEEIVFPYGATVDTLVDAASAFRAFLGRGKDGDLHNLVPSGSDAVAYSRTPAKVLATVFGGAGKTNGVFFPRGVKGATKSS